MSPDQQDWAKRRRRLTKCKKHGLHYDSELTSGCALCRKEGLLTSQKRSGPQFLVLLLTLLGLALLAFNFVNTVRERRAAEAAADDEQVASSKIDPEPMRREIEALEQLLGSAPEDGLSTVGQDLAARAQGVRFEVSRQDVAMSEQTLRSLDDWIASIPEDGFSAAHLRSARNTWRRIAARGFRTADWWSPTGSASPDSRRTTLVAYREAANDLVALADEGAAQAAAFADPEFEVEDESWAEYAEDWERRISELDRRLPSQSEFGADSELLVGVQDLRNALGQLRRLAADRGLPSRGDSRARFERAIEMAERARGTFDTLLLG